MHLLKFPTLPSGRIESRPRNIQESARSRMARANLPWRPNARRGSGRWRVTTPGATVSPLPSTGSGWALNQQEGRFDTRRMPFEPTMFMIRKGFVDAAGWGGTREGSSLRYQAGIFDLRFEISDLRKD